MALFNTPNLLDIIWRKQEFPQDGGGLAGLLGGFGSGLGVGKKFKADKKAWNENEAAEQGGTKSTKTWGEVGRQDPIEKPNAFHYFFGQGYNPPGDPAGASQPAAFNLGGGYGQTATPSATLSGETHDSIDKWINAIMAMFGVGGKQGGSMLMPR